MKKLLLILPFLTLVNYSTAQMVLSAQATSQSCDCYTLTADVDNIYGGIFSPNTIDLNSAFDFSFDVYLGNVDNWTADGIAFILQQGQIVVNDNPPAFGSLGLTPSIGVEIDVHLDSRFTGPSVDSTTLKKSTSDWHTFVQVVLV